MKFTVSFLLMAIASFAACLFLPWWSIAIVCFIIAAVIPQKSGIAFVCGFLALFVLWGGLAFWISNNNGHILAHRVSLLILKQDNPYYLILVTALIGALVAGLAAFAGSFLSSNRK